MRIALGQMDQILKLRCNRYLGKVNKLKEVCKNLRRVNKEEEYIFGLDAFYYQIIIFESDYTYYKKLYSLYLDQLILILNNYHKIDRTKQYWEPIVGLYLRKLIFNDFEYR